MRLLVCFFVFLMAVALPAYAGDEGLYAPKPPLGAAFVRFYNGTAEHVSANIGGKSYGDIQPFAATPYYVQSQGPVEFKTGLKSVLHKMEPDSFYTVISDGAGNPLIHKDTVTQDPAKSMIVLYNLGSDAALTLKAQDGLIAVLENVERGKSAHRGINGTKVDFTLVDAAGNTLHTFEPMVLDRGRTYSVFYAGGKAIIARGETDTTR